MKSRIFTLMFFISLLISSKANETSDFIYDGFFFKIISAEKKTVEIVGAEKNDISEINISYESVIYNDQEYTIVSIGEMAFEKYNHLKTLYIGIPDLLIKANAFQYCKNLETVFVGDNSVESAIGQFILTSGKLESDAFAYCTSLKNVTILGGTITKPFNSCTGIKEIYINGGDINGLAIFDLNLDILEINGGHINDLNGSRINKLIVNGGELEEKILVGRKINLLEFGDNVRSIKNNVFQSTTIETVNINKNILEIREYAFAYSSITFLNIDCTLIGEKAFFWSNISNLHFGENVEEIEHMAFVHCTGFDELYVNVPKIESAAFQGCNYTQLTIGEDVEFMDMPFTWNEKLRYVYYNARNAQADAICIVSDNIRKIIFGENVESISGRTFSTLDYLRDVECLGKNPPIIESICFNNLTYARGELTIPEESLSLYLKNNVWNKFYYINGEHYDVGADDNNGLETINDAPSFNIRIIDEIIIIEGSISYPLEIYSIDGRLEYKGYDSSISGLTHGVHIIKVGTEQVKIIL